MKTLQDQKEVIVARKEALEVVRGNIYVREQQALSQVLNSYFGGFPSDIEIEVARGSVYFKMDHPEVNYKKELFNIYLRETYSFEAKNKAYDSVDLSYYSTSVRGTDTWELRRLQLLGEVAKIVYEEQQQILDTVNEVALSFKGEYREVFEEMEIVGKELREIEKQISDNKCEQIKASLMNGGVEFTKLVTVALKFNYSVNIKSIKLIDVSASGKTATAVFTWAHGDHISREENVNVEKITSQVMAIKSCIALL